MIRKLRRRHRMMWSLIALAAVVLFAVALGARRPPVIMTEPLFTETQPTGAAHFEQTDLWTEVTIDTRTLRNEGQWWLELTPRKPISHPDILVYWRTGQSLEDAYLLGELGGLEPRAYKLPTEAVGRDGELLLYSLAHAQDVATTTLPARATQENQP